MHSRKLVDMMPAAVAPVNTLSTKYHQKDGTRAEHMPLRAVTAHAIPSVLFRPEQHAQYLNSAATNILEHSETSDRAVLKDSMIMHMMHNKTSDILRAGERSVSADLQCILDAFVLLQFATFGLCQTDDHAILDYFNCCNVFAVMKISFLPRESRQKHEACCSPNSSAICWNRNRPPRDPRKNPEFANCSIQVLPQIRSHPEAME